MVLALHGCRLRGDHRVGRSAFVFMKAVVITIEQIAGDNAAGDLHVTLKVAHQGIVTPGETEAADILFDQLDELLHKGRVSDKFMFVPRENPELAKQ